MRVAWLHHDFEPDFSRSGGAQLTIQRRIDVGAARGHTVECVSPSDIDMLPGSFDLYILSDTKNCFLEVIDELEPKVRVFHNYPFCRYYTHICSWGIQAGDMPFRERLQLMWCMLNRQCRGVRDDMDLYFFLSPLHQQLTEQFLGYPLDNAFVVPSSIDAGMFYSMGEKREGACAIGTSRYHKGIDNVRKWCDIHNVSLSLISDVPHDELNNVYNKYKYFVHLPYWFEPCGRAVFEARLAGCHPILNTRVGASSFEWWNDADDVFRSKLEDSIGAFWGILEEIYEEEKTVDEVMIHG